LIGGKAWSIARMRALELNVPPAFVVTTEACAEYLANDALAPEVLAEIDAGMAWLEAETGRTFGHGDKPLLVSVRSGAAVSMPGMMDTVLNLGINDATEEALALESGDPAFARDTHRRFYELHASIVLKATIPALDPLASAAQWRETIAASVGQSVLDDPREQLIGAVSAVFASWNSRRARRYRKHHHIPDSLGTAVTVQAMVFGNLDAGSGTGVLFSRNPLSGEPTPYGEYLASAQGEDVVSGKFTPEPLESLRATLPECYAQLLSAAACLEHEHGDVQDIEFTVQHGELFLLQARAAKRAPRAAVRIAVDMVNEGRIDTATALARVTAEQVRNLLSAHLADGSEHAAVLANGEPACQGVAVGIVVDNSDDAERLAAAGASVVLARATTSPEDVHGMIASAAVITEQGGATSHAAVIGRALGVPCIVGCGSDTVTSLVGQTVTVDGGSGNIYRGALAVVMPREEDDDYLVALAEWARAASPIQVARPGETVTGKHLDLDHVDGGEDPDKLPELLPGYDAVQGGAIACEAGVKAAVAAGVTTIIAAPVLPMLLAAIHTHGDGPERDQG
jgi:pyruvate,orthophosphate dikinase